MLGLRKIDPLKVRLLDVDGDLRQAGATRRLAELFASNDPFVACVHHIDEGDALALATRFDREWAYGSGTALFWHREIHAARIHDRSLPAAVRRPFERRALLHVEARYENEPFSIVAASLGEDRATCLRDLRAVRSLLREIEGAAVAFIANGAASPFGFTDLHFTSVSTGDYNLIVVRPSHATPAPQTAGSHDASASIVRI